MTKEQLRILYKKKRDSLGEQTRTSYDEDILRYLQSMDWSEVRFVHIYLPISKSNEPDTLKFMQWLRKLRKDIQFVISRSDLQHHEMVHYVWDEHMVLETNRWGILEPKEGVIIEESALDVILVPLLIADTQGNRVGYGKGFYDRFLAKCNPEVKSIGLSYFDPVEEITDVGEWDVKLRYCITPNGVYEMNKASI